MARVRVGVGDRVRVSKFVLDTDYHGEGTVTKLLRDGIGEPYFQLTDDGGHVDYWSPLNDLMNSCEVLQRAPVEDDGRPSCHYCGMPATHIGFFGEHVCNECR